MARTSSLPRIVALLIGALLVAGCGGSSKTEYVPVPVTGPTGEVDVDNLTDLEPPPDDLIDFALSLSGEYLWTENLLSAPLGPGEVEFVGSYIEEYYDAFGEFFNEPAIVEWFDVFIERDFVTTFEAY